LLLLLLLLFPHLEDPAELMVGLGQQHVEVHLVEGKDVLGVDEAAGRGRRRDLVSGE